MTMCSCCCGGGIYVAMVVACRRGGGQVVVSNFQESPPLVDFLAPVHHKPVTALSVFSCDV